MSKKTVVLITFLYFTLYHSFLLASEQPYVEGQLLVRLTEKPDGKIRTIDERNQILASMNGGIGQSCSKFIPGLTLVKLPEHLTVEDALPVFKGSDKILSAQPNYIYHTVSTFPDDPEFDDLWGMHNTGQTDGTEDADIDAPQAWDIQTGSKDIIVAVLDTGVDYNHPDLKNNIWINETEMNGEPDVDDDDNGVIDDIYGYDFCNDDSDPMDDNSHGTHCAGTIGAVGNNNEGVAGVCWNVKIMALKFLDSMWDLYQDLTEESAG